MRSCNHCRRRWRAVQGAWCMLYHLKGIGNSEETSVINVCLPTKRHTHRHIKMASRSRFLALPDLVLVLRQIVSYDFDSKLVVEPFGPETGMFACHYMRSRVAKGLCKVSSGASSIHLKCMYCHIIIYVQIHWTAGRSMEARSSIQWGPRPKNRINRPKFSTARTSNSGIRSLCCQVIVLLVKFCGIKCFIYSHGICSLGVHYLN